MTAEDVVGGSRININGAADFLAPNGGNVFAKLNSSHFGLLLRLSIKLFGDAIVCKMEIFLDFFDIGFGGTGQAG